MQFRIEQGFSVGNGLGAGSGFSAGEEFCGGSGFCAGCDFATNLLRSHPVFGRKYITIAGKRSATIGLEL